MTTTFGGTLQERIERLILLRNKLIEQGDLENAKITDNILHGVIEHNFSIAGRWT